MKEDLHYFLSRDIISNKDDYDITLCVLTFLYFSHACTIQLEDQVISTGGGNGIQIISRVYVYNIDGWVRNMPDLNTARSYHACGHYTNSDDKIVNSMKDKY